MFIFYSFVVTFTGLNVIYYKNYLPNFLNRMFGFGKINKEYSKIKSFVQFFEVPKRWFSHFYIAASVFVLFIMISVLQAYFSRKSSYYLIQLLDFCTTENRKSSVTAESVIIVSFLITLQVFRRCYECCYISVYSDSKMNIIHYIVGLTFYFGVGLSLIAEAPGFESKMKDPLNSYILGKWFLWQHITGICLFFFAFILQFQTHVMFASFRKDKTGKKVVSLNHHMPRGGWFEYVSCPHYFAEILIYFSTNLIFNGQNYGWWLVCLWTISNQIIAGFLNHRWYQETFKNYPAQRKAVIPFIL